jgi:ketosteroid isomerase-like protein
MRIPGFRSTREPTDVTRSPDGQMACMLGRNEVTVNDGDGAPVTTARRAVTVWRRGPDGE